MNEHISDEDWAIIAFMKASGVSHVVTCTNMENFNQEYFPFVDAS